mmetsp:Transcript_87255/g.224728  ORF Transcript_87255/g.224728 Transcript_87255/m.224728 type:complete len:237 (+) Transcript_87255:400-1110(+)
MTPAFTRIVPTSNTPIERHSTPSRSTSREDPTVRKKRPSRSPRKGVSVSSMFFRCEESASSAPARKAPKLSERPIALVQRLVIRTVQTTAEVSASERSPKLFAVDCRNGLATKRDAATTPPSVSRPFRPSATIAMTPSTESGGGWPPLCRLCSTGIRARRGTTARSCSSSTPTTAFPSFDWTSPRSARSCSTKAEEERLSPTPSTTASTSDVTETSFGSASPRNSSSCVPMAWPGG